MIDTEQQVLVVGGGIIGIACAHFLHRDGHRVTVIDQNEIGSGCSHANCGLICPSHVLPLAEPGAIREAAAAMLRSGSPFRIRPRLDAHLWHWLYRFALRCNERDMVASGRAAQPLLQSSLQLYEELMGDASMQCEWHRRGLLFVYKSRKQFEAYTATNELLTREFHEPARRIEGRDLQGFEPTLREGLAGGWYFGQDAHLRPDRLITSWRAALTARGVRFREFCRLERFDPTQGTVRTASTTGDTFSTDVVVIATGAQTPELKTVLRKRIPIEPGKGYSVTLPNVPQMPTHPMIFPEHRVAVTPMESGLRLGSIMEFTGYDNRIPPQRLSLLTSGASEYFRGQPFDQQWPGRWFGWRPMTFDSVPIIGCCPGFTNVYVATGHNMLGLSMAPATGLLVSDLVSGRSPHIPAGPYAVDRF